MGKPSWKLQTENTKMKHVQQFKFLRHIVAKEDGKCDIENRSYIGIAKNAF